jgi:rare lipoprotein A
LKKLLVIILLFLISACAELNLANHLTKKIFMSNTKDKEENEKYYNDGKVKPYYKVGNPYFINGKKYIPKEMDTYYEKGIASWYGPKFDGKLTANGEIFNQYDVTAAHKTLPLPSLVKVTNLENNRNIILRINDRGPFVDNRIIDLSYKSAQLLGIVDKGTALVSVELLEYGEHLLSHSKNKNITKNIKDKLLFIQVGVFKNPVTADNISRKLRNTDYLKHKVFIKTLNINEEFLYIVKIGPIKYNEDAMYVQRKLKGDEILSKIVVE